MVPSYNGWPPSSKKEPMAGASAVQKSQTRGEQQRAGTSVYTRRVHSREAWSGPSSSVLTSTERRCVGAGGSLEQKGQKNTVRVMGEPCVFPGRWLSSSFAPQSAPWRPEGPVSPCAGHFHLCSQASSSPASCHLCGKPGRAAGQEETLNSGKRDLQCNPVLSPSGPVTLNE